ncbi:hypothetical protein ACFQ0Q_25035 [Streptomyces aureus]
MGKYRGRGLVDDGTGGGRHSAHGAGGGGRDVLGVARDLRRGAVRLGRDALDLGGGALDLALRAGHRAVDVGGERGQGAEQVVDLLGGAVLGGCGPVAGVLRDGAGRHVRDPGGVGVRGAGGDGAGGVGDRGDALDVGAGLLLGVRGDGLDPGVGVPDGALGAGDSGTGLGSGLGGGAGDRSGDGGGGAGRGRPALAGHARHGVLGLAGDRADGAVGDVVDGALDVGDRALYIGDHVTGQVRHRHGVGGHFVGAGDGGAERPRTGDAGGYHDGTADVLVHACVRSFEFWIPVPRWSGPAVGRRHPAGVVRSAGRPVPPPRGRSRAGNGLP